MKFNYDYALHMLILGLITILYAHVMLALDKYIGIVFLLPFSFILVLILALIFGFTTKGK